LMLPAPDPVLGDETGDDAGVRHRAPGEGLLLRHCTTCDEIDALTVVLMWQRRPLLLVLEVEPCARQRVEEFLATVEGTADCGDAVAEELIDEDVAVAQVGRDRQHAVVAEDPPQLCKAEGKLVAVEVLQGVVRDDKRAAAVPKREPAEIGQRGA